MSLIALIVKNNMKKLKLQLTPKLADIARTGQATKQ
jgi:hypothetical protein